LTDDSEDPGTPWKRWLILLHSEHLKPVLVALFLLLIGTIFFFVTLLAAFERPISETILFFFITVLTLVPGSKFIDASDAKYVVLIDILFSLRRVDYLEYYYGLFGILARNYGLKGKKKTN
jgi:hypothetical protein